jgi:soluble lytic murein transglycosylase-like protein
VGTEGDVTRRLFLWTCIAVAVLGWSSAARADGLDRYAAALRTFDPRLAPVQARHLATRVVTEADAAGLDARLVVALVAIESSWDVDARSRAGALGLGQLMPGTAADLGVDPRDPEANLHGTVVYLRALAARYAPCADPWPLTLAAYNAGPGAVERCDAFPPFAETRTYVVRVLALWRRLVRG